MYNSLEVLSSIAIAAVFTAHAQLIGIATVTTTPESREPVVVSVSNAKRPALAQSSNLIFLDFYKHACMGSKL